MRRRMTGMVGAIALMGLCVPAAADAGLLRSVVKPLLPVTLGPLTPCQPLSVPGYQATSCKLDLGVLNYECVTRRLGGSTSQYCAVRSGTARPILACHSDSGSADAAGCNVGLSTTRLSCDDEVPGPSTTGANECRLTGLGAPIVIPLP